MKYQVLSRRSGKGELRKFVLDVVNFASDDSLFSAWDRWITVYTGDGLYVAGEYDGCKRQYPAFIPTSIEPVRVATSYQIHWLINKVGEAWYSDRWNTCGDMTFSKLDIPVPVRDIAASVNADWVEDVWGYGWRGDIWALSNNGDVWVMGTNEWDQLGMGPDCGAITSFVKNHHFSDSIQKVAYNDMVGAGVLFLSTKGSVYVAGESYRGTLGLGEANMASYPIEIDYLPEKIVDITWLSPARSALIGASGNVYQSGLSGHGYLPDLRVFTHIPGLGKVRQIAAVYPGTTQVLFIKRTGELAMYTVKFVQENPVESVVNVTMVGDAPKRLYRTNSNFIRYFVLGDSNQVYTVEQDGDGGFVATPLPFSLIGSGCIDY